MTKPKQGDFPEIAKEIKAMMSLADNFDQKKQAIEIAMKFEALRLKAKGRDFGKGFDEGDEDETF